MAITIGKTATVVLNRFCNLVLKPEPVATGGGGGDVTPNPTPNWGTVGYNDIISQWQYSEQQIQGIDTTITLQTNYNNTTSGTLWYLVGNSPAGLSSTLPPIDQGFAFLANGGTFTVSSNQYVCFGGDFDSLSPSTNIVTVLNQSNGGVTLDTFTLRVDI